MTNKDRSLDFKIFKAAEEEFLEKGYQDASLRSIAKKAGVTTGAIYTRYKSKEELFYELCKDTIAAMEDYYYKSQCDANELKKVLGDLSLLQESFNLHSHLILSHIMELTLLLFKSSGSEYENYRESLIQDYVDYFSEKLSSESGGTAFDYSKSSTMVLRTIASCYVAYVEELVLHGKEDEEVVAYRKKVATFVHSIFQSLLDYKN